MNKDTHSTSKSNPCGVSSPAENIAEAKSPASQIHSTTPLVRITEIFDPFQRGLFSIFHKYQIIAITHDRIIIGRSIRYPKLSETHFEPGKIKDYVKNTRFHREIAFDDIIAAKSDFSHGLLVFVTIVTRDANQVLFFDFRDIADSYKQLETLLGSRLRVESGSRKSTLHFMILTIIWVGFFAILRLSVNELLPEERFILLPAVAAFAIVFALDRVLGLMNSGPSPTVTHTAPIPRRRDNPLARKQPFRSRLFGIIIKIAAVAWTILATTFVLIVARRPAVDSVSDSLSYYLSTNTNFAIALFSIPAVGLLYLGQSLMQVGVTHATAMDRRRPFLFLRSFDLDGDTTLQPKTALAAYLGVSGSGSFRSHLTEHVTGLDLIFLFKLVQLVHPLRIIRILCGIQSDSTEQSIVHYFSRFGPVVAIGKPGEVVATAGAFREYVADESWKATVYRYLDCCQAVVIQPSNTEGVKWEIMTVFERLPKHRIVIVFSSRPGLASEYDRFKSDLEANLGLYLPAHAPFLGNPFVIWFEHNGIARCSEVSYYSPLTWAFRGDAVDLDHTLRPFLKNLTDIGSEAPYDARIHHWYEYAGAWLFAMFGLGVFGILTSPKVYPKTTPVVELPRQSPSTYPEKEEFHIVHGTAIPYQLTIPVDWRTKTPTAPSMEYLFLIDNCGMLVVIVLPDMVDLSTIAEEIRSFEASDENIQGTVNIDSSEDVWIHQTLFKSIRLSATLKSGSRAIVDSLVYSGAGGTLIIKGSIIDADDTIVERKALANAMHSIRILP
jgi:hypothetical protein